MTTVQQPTSEKLATVVRRLTDEVRRIAEEEGVSYPELFEGLLFLNEVGAAGEMVLLSDVLGVSTHLERLDAAGQPGTASNVEGPFWRPGAPRYPSPAVLAGPEEPGEPLVLSGTVTDAATGAPLPAATIDIWQTDAGGHYDHEDPALPDWHLRGVVVADGAGRYEVRLVKPLAYQVPTSGPVGRLLAAVGRHPWRPAHTHLKVSAPGYPTLTTMAYYAGDPWLHDDTIGSVKPDLVLDPVRGPDGVWRCTFDISLPASDATHR
ncbi:MAG: dioxygenase [Mycobacteriales bacterium]